MLLEKTPSFYPIERIREDYAKVEPLFNHLNQLCLTRKRDALSDEEALYEGCGGLKAGSNESDYSEINPLFRGTIFEQIIQESPYRIGRARIFKLAPRTSMSLHGDLENRVHWAIHTHPDCFLAFQTGQGSGVFYHIPADGYGYFARTVLRHVAVNPSTEMRSHFVLNILGKK